MLNYRFSDIAQSFVLFITVVLFILFISIARDPGRLRHNNFAFYALNAVGAVSLVVAAIAVLSKDVDLTAATATVLILYGQTYISTSTARAIDRGSRYQYISDTSVSPDGNETSVSPDARRLRSL